MIEIEGGSALALMIKSKHHCCSAGNHEGVLEVFEYLGLISDEGGKKETDLIRRRKAESQGCYMKERW